MDSGRKGQLEDLDLAQRMQRYNLLPLCFVKFKLEEFLRI